MPDPAPAADPTVDYVLPPDAMDALETALVAQGGAPRGPRSLARRLGPLTSVLVLGVVAAAGFLGGVQVQKGQQPAATVVAGGAAAAARARAGSGGSAGATGGAGGAAGQRGGGGFGGGAATFGQVKLVDGANVYVGDSQGNTVKVVTSDASRFTKTGPGSIADVHPGDTVVVQGRTDAQGIVTATALTDNGAAGQ